MPSNFFNELRSIEDSKVDRVDIVDIVEIVDIERSFFLSSELFMNIYFGILVPSLLAYGLHSPLSVMKLNDFLLI